MDIRLREYQQRKAEEKTKHVDSRPPWRPAGRATTTCPSVKQSGQVEPKKVTKRVIKSVLPRPTLGINLEGHVRLSMTESQPETPEAEPSNSTATTPETVQANAESLLVAAISPSNDGLG